jgi:hypothetical protein
LTYRNLTDYAKKRNRALPIFDDPVNIRPGMIIPLTLKSILPILAHTKGFFAKQGQTGDRIMKKTIILSVMLILFSSSSAQASFLDLLRDTLDAARKTQSTDTKIERGLKEALTVGMENTVAYLGRNDGYFANQAVKILLPEEVRQAEKVLRGVGFGPQLDEFTLSMNRAAEKAAPLAADIFATAITEMSFDDANRILRGGNTAATDYLKSKTRDKLLERFQPAVRRAMSEYNVTQQYEAITGKVQNLPLVGKVIHLDVNRYVSSKALDGLFHVLAQEETSIRTNPKARVTDLLKEVFK